MLDHLTRLGLFYIKLNTPGRLQDTNIFSIINKSKVSDFQWDPYDDETIAAG
jgi:hypothetical protein